MARTRRYLIGLIIVGSAILLAGLLGFAHVVSVQAPSGDERAEGIVVLTGGTARIEAGLKLLEGEAYEIHGVGFAGGKGFIGGYGRHMLSAFGEPAVHAFVQASIDENLKLESSLRMLKTERTVVVLHYSPIAQTLEGEPLEIFPFLGSARMGETIDRYDNVSLVVHGHAHRGQAEGRTNKGTPVYNVALPVLRTLGDAPYRVFEV